MSNSSDGGEAILEGMRALGVDWIFSSPGSEWGPVWEALARQRLGNHAGPGYLDCWHETLAVDMAIGFTLMTGRMQAVLLHAGTGLLQGAMGIQAAQLGEVPMLVMSGEALGYGEQPDFDPGAQWYRSLSIVGGPQRLVESYTKFAGQVGSVHTLYESVVRGGEMAQRVPMGPVYLNAPIEMMLSPWTPPARQRVVPTRPLTQPSAADVEHVAKLLLDAACPVVSTDDAGRDPAAFAALVELAELLGMPVIEGPSSATANFPRSNDLHLGSDIGILRGEADMVLLVASRAPWYPPSAAPPGATVVAVGENPLKAHVVYQNLQADFYLQGDVAATLRLLSAAVRDGGGLRTAARRARWAREHARQRAARLVAEQAVRDNAPIDPLHLLAELRTALPADAVVVEETVLHAALAQRHLERDGALSFFHPRGGLGQALGMALGCKLAARDRTVVALLGDGALLYNPVVQAFGASRTEGLPLLIVVFNNRGYAAMRENHRSYYPDGVAVRADVWHGVHIDGPDYAELGRPFGFGGRLVERPGEVAAALQEGLAEVREGRTFIVNVVLSK